LNSGFLITDAGLAAATIAAPGGPYVHIHEYRIGSTFNYTPTRDQTGLMGTTLYTGTPQSYTIIDTDISQALCVMDETVGTFEWGEMGLYLQDGTLFAICVWDKLQEKVKAVGNQAGNIWKIHALLKLAQAPAIVQITTVNSQGILEVPVWPLLAKPFDQPNGANVAIIHDDDASGSPVLVIRDNDNEWAPVAYTKIFEGSTTYPGAVATTTTLQHPLLTNYSFEVPNTTSKYLVRFPDGQLRKLLDKNPQDTITWGPGVTAPNGTVSIWQSDNISDTIYWADTYEYNKLVAMFNPYWSTPNGTYSTSNKGMNQVAIPTLTRRTTTADWEIVLRAMRDVSNIVNVNPSPITGFNDFIYRPNNPSYMGIQTHREHWDAVIAQIGLIDTHRNSINPLYQTLSAYPDQTFAPYWGGTKSHYFSFTYPDNNTAHGHFNSGHTLTLTPTVTNAVVTPWINLAANFTALGSLSFGPTATVASAGWHVTAVCLQTLNTTDQAMASFTNLNGWSCTVYGKLIGGVVTITMVLNNMTSGAYTYSAPGTIHFAWSSRKATLLVNPVLPHPTLAYTQSP